MPRKPDSKACPLCGKASSSSHAPFCSHGCKDRDLLKWLGEGYRIPGPAADQGEFGGLDSESREG